MADFTYDSFKGHLLSGNISLTSDALGVILVSGTYPVASADSHFRYADISSHEVFNGNGYAAYGKPLTSKTITTTPASDYSTFTAANVTWSSSTITASGAIIYASGTFGGVTNPLISFLDFGSNKSSSNGDFTLQWNAQGILRINNS